MAAFYLLVGLDFEIFQYQFQSRLRKLILILIVGGAIGASVVIFQAIDESIINTINHGSRLCLSICKSVASF